MSYKLMVKRKASHLHGTGAADNRNQVHCQKRDTLRACRSGYRYRSSCHTCIHTCIHSIQTCPCILHPSILPSIHPCIHPYMLDYKLQHGFALSCYPSVALFRSLTFSLLVLICAVTYMGGATFASSGKDCQTVMQCQFGIKASGIWVPSLFFQAQTPPPPPHPPKPEAETPSLCWGVHPSAHATPEVRGLPL